MTTRSTAHPIDPIFLDRWSPRAFDGSVMPEADLLTMLDAARWAASSFNYQPWRFLYALRGTPDFDRFLNLLMPFNAAWAKAASALLIVVSDREMVMGDKSNPSHSHSFDAGAAWAQLALQATRMGYHTHGMAGVDFDRARTELSVPDRFRLEAAIAVGRIGDPATLPDKLREREFPSDRKPLDEIAYPGNFRA
ncbi:MAG: nitroreductase family protein [Sphingomicrobium sp.]